MNSYTSRFYFVNKHLVFFVKNFVYPLTIVSVFFYLISYIVLLKTDKIADLDSTSVYVSDNITENRDSIANSVQYGIKRARRKGINTDLNAKIVFCHSPLEYSLRCLFISANSFAQTRDFMHRVIIGPMKDTTKHEQVQREEQLDTVFAPRYRVEIISHELAHIYQYEKLGIWGMYWRKICEEWKIEGYADYVGGNSSMRVELGKRMFLEGKYSDESLAICESFFVNYFVGRLRTDYILNFKKIPEDEYWETSYDEEKLDEEIRIALREGFYEFFRQNEYE